MTYFRRLHQVSRLRLLIRLLDVQQLGLLVNRIPLSDKGAGRALSVALSARHEESPMVVTLRSSLERALAGRQLRPRRTAPASAALLSPRAAPPSRSVLPRCNDALLLQVRS